MSVVIFAIVAACFLFAAYNIVIGLVEIAASTVIAALALVVLCMASCWENFTLLWRFSCWIASFCQRKS